MGCLDTLCFYCIVYHCRVQLFMAQEFLYLLNWHPSPQKVSCYRPPEPVWMHPFYSCFIPQVTQHILNPWYTQTLMGAV